MNISIDLTTETIKADKNVTADQAAVAVVQTAVVAKAVRDQLHKEQNRLVKQFGINKGLKLAPEKNPCGKGSNWAKARAELSKRIEVNADGRNIGLKTKESCDKAANRALNAAGFISRQSVKQTDFERYVVLNAMAHCATRDKDGNVTDVDLDTVAQYLGGYESDAGKAASTHFDEIAEKKFGLELTEA